MTDAQLSRSRSPIHLTNEDGRRIELQGRPMADGDIDEMNEWLRVEFSRRTEQSVAGFSDPELRNSILREAAVVCRTVSLWDDGIGSEIGWNVDGVARLIWLAVREDHPSLTPGRLTKLFIQHPENLTAATGYWARINRMGGEEPGEPERAATKKPAKKKRPRRKPKSTKR